jgi:hypothetical protein
MGNINTLYDAHAPTRMFRVTHKAVPWMTERIIKLQKYRDNCFRLYKKDKSPSNFNEYKCYRNKVKQLIRNAKKKYYAQRLKKIYQVKLCGIMFVI